MSSNVFLITAEYYSYKMLSPFLVYSKELINNNKLDVSAIPYAGIIFAIISVLFWSTAGLCFKLSVDVHALEVLAISAFIQSFIYFVVIICQKQHYFGEPNERIHLILRCSLGTVSMACLYTSYRLINLSDATTIRFTAPLFVSVFAFILLREPFGPVHMLSAGLTLTGVLLVGQPTFLFGSSEVVSKQPSDESSRTEILGLILALTSAITIAISMTVMRKLQKTSSAVIIFWFSASTVALGIVALSILDEFKWPSNYTWIIIIIAGLCGAADQIFITMALKLEHAGPIAMVQALNVVISFIFSLTILNESISLFSFFGGVLIFISICIVSGYKWYKDFSNDHTKEIPQTFSDKEIGPVYMIRPIDPSDPDVFVNFSN